MTKLTANKPMRQTGIHQITGHVGFSRVVGFVLLLTLGQLGACATRVATSAAPLAVPYEGSFALVFDAGHGPKLAVVTPDERWMVLVENTVLNGLMTEKEFLATTRLNIDTRLLKGIAFEDAEEVIEPVFTLPGTYRFIASDSLEADPQNMLSVTIKVAYE